MDTKNIIKWVRETSASQLPYNAGGIGWGPKEINGQETGEYCVIFFVKEKKPLDQLSEVEIIPKELSINSAMVKTDVRVQQKHIHSTLADCHVLSDSIDPVAANRKRHRPLKAGTASMCEWTNFLFQGRVATLGTFVIDKNDGQIVALSNNHVYADSQVIARHYTKNTVFSETNTKNLSAYQPPLNPGVTYITTPEGKRVSLDCIGTCKTPVVIGNEDSDLDNFGVIKETTCDAATVRLTGYNLIDFTSLQPLGFDYPPPYDFATDEEIDSLLDVSSPNYSAPVFRSGRTCGPIGYPGNTYSCSLSVTFFGDALVGVYNNFDSFFTNCIFYRGNVVAGRAGDSGSAMYALFNRNDPSLSAWKLIGLNFAGPVTNPPPYSVGCRITSIVEALKIAPWDGTTIPSLSSRPIYTITTDISSSTIMLSGRLFYQIGGTEF